MGEDPLSVDDRAARAVPEVSIARLPLYLRALTQIAGAGGTTVSSAALGRATAVNSAMVRKDLSYLGTYGTRGVGYDVAYLIHQIRRELGLTQDWSVLLAGAGNLGRALAGYRGFAERGFRIVAIVDSDPAKVGEVIGGLRVQPARRLAACVRRRGAAIGVIATPAGVAQEVADRMVAAGIRSILDFAPAVIQVPAEVSVRKVDLALELQVLAYHEQRKAALRFVGSSAEASGAL